jgi:hypothetical protein
MASKIYIMVKSEVDLGHALLACAHASLACYLDNQGDPEMQKYVKESFRKVVCRVDGQQFDEAKTHMLPGDRVMTESGLGGMEVAVVFKPRDQWNKFFHSLPLYR